MVKEIRYSDLSSYRNRVHMLDVVNGVSSFFSALLYYLVGVFGYFAFGSSIQENILGNFVSLQFGFVHLVKAAYAVVMICSNPVIVYPSILTIDKWFFSSSSTLLRRLVEGMIWSLLAWIVALMLPHLTIVFGLTGSTGGFIMIFTLPALFYIRICHRSRRMKKRGEDRSWLYISAHIVLWLSIVLGMIATIVQIQSFSCIC